MFITLITLLLYPVHSTQTRDGLSVYTESLPIDFYNKMNYRLLTFSVTIPSYQEDETTLAELSKNMVKLTTYKVEGSSLRGTGILTTTRDIKLLTDKIMMHIEEIGRYKNSNCQGINITGHSPCHINFEQPEES